MTHSNYEYTLEQARQSFLHYDQENMVQKFQLKRDDTYLYLHFIGRLYRIHRCTGLVQWLDEAGLAHNANFQEGMSIYDALCYSKPNCHLSGQFAPINSVAKSFHSSGLGETLYDEKAAIFSKYPSRLETACLKLDGVKAGRGDISYQLKVFPFLPVLLQFWMPDDEFQASLQILWDMNTLDFVHYETTYYIAAHLYARLQELAGIS